MTETKLWNNLQIQLKLNEKPMWSVSCDPLLIYLIVMDEIYRSPCKISNLGETVHFGFCQPKIIVNRLHSMDRLPRIVATFVCASSQLQPTNFAQTIWSTTPCAYFMSLWFLCCLFPAQDEESVVKSYRLLLLFHCLKHFLLDLSWGQGFAD